MTITVTNVEEDPEVMGDASPDYAENATNVVETYMGADDEDGEDNTLVTFSLEGTDAGKFGISNGDLTILGNSSSIHRPISRPAGMRTETMPIR